jgi:glycosyltransferase involved in cell wall biosynthesis
MKSNILIIVQNLPVPFDRRVWQEATSLQRAGYGVSVICPKKKIYTKSYEKLEGVEIYRYRLFLEADEGVVGYFIEFIYCWLATAFLAVRVFLKRRFGVIHACNPPDTYFLLGLLFRIFGVKFIFDHHDLCPEMYVAKGRPRSGVLYNGLLLLERWTMRSAALVFTTNQSHRQIAVQRDNVPEDKVVIVRSGPSRSWASLNLETPSLKQGRKYHVMYLGEMCEQDGVDYLLRAISIYSNLVTETDTLFTLVGGGPDQARMRQMAHDMGLDSWVHFTGRVSDEDLWAQLSTTDLCVDPDPKTEWSDMSTMNKMIEYLAFGKPVVAFDLREHRFTAGDCAEFVEANNEEAMAHAIRALLLDPERRTEMGKKGKIRFQTMLAWENAEKILIASYDKLTEQ